MTLITNGHDPDQVGERARAAFDEHALSQLMFAITAINAWNRLMITTRGPGHYQPANGKRHWPTDPSTTPRPLEGRTSQGRSCRLRIG